MSDEVQAFFGFLVGLFVAGMVFGYCGGPAACETGQRYALDVTSPCTADAGLAKVRVNDNDWVCIDGRWRIVE